MYTCRQYPYVIFESLENIGEKFQNVLDLGCGYGRIINEIIRFSSKNLYCTDIDLSKLKKLYQLIKNGQVNNSNKIQIHVFQSDAKNIPLRDSSIDLVFCCITVIEHIDNPIRMLEKIKRILKPNGYIVIINDILMYRILEYFGIWKHPPDPTHIYMVTPNKLEKLLKSVGFEIVDKYHTIPFERKIWIRFKIKRFLPSFLAEKGQFLCKVKK